MIEDAPTRFDFPEPARIAPPILALDRVAVGYDGTPVLRNVSLAIDMDDRIALLGANGNGKSTLAKLLAERLPALAGEIRRGPKLRVGYFAQHQTDELVESETPIDHMTRALPRASPPQVRAQLARFGLDADRAETPVANLSGGEKARLLLSLATREAPQLLILDEPTNHLDIDAREALVKALADFQGAVLLITHDPHLVELIAERLWLVADGTVRPFDGDLDDYRALLAERARPAAKPDAGNRRDDRRERADARAALAPLRKQARDAEARLARLADRARGDRADAGRSRALRSHAARRRSPPRTHAWRQSGNLPRPPNRSGWRRRKHWKRRPDFPCAAAVAKRPCRSHVAADDHECVHLDHDNWRRLGAGGPLEPERGAERRYGDGSPAWQASAATPLRLRAAKARSSTPSRWAI